MHHAAPPCAPFETPSQTPTGDVTPIMLGGSLSTSGPIAPSRTAWPQVVFLFTYWGLGQFLNANGARMRDMDFRTPKAIPVISTPYTHQTITPTTSSSVPLPTTSATLTHQGEPAEDRHHVKVVQSTESPHSDYSEPTVSLHPSTDSGFSTVTDTGWVDHGGGGGEDSGSKTSAPHSTETPQLTVSTTLRETVSLPSGGGQRQAPQPSSNSPANSALDEQSILQETHHVNVISAPGDTAIVDGLMVDAGSTKLSIYDSHNMQTGLETSDIAPTSHTDVVRTSLRTGSQLRSIVGYNPIHGHVGDGQHRGGDVISRSQADQRESIVQSIAISLAATCIHSTDSDCPTVGSSASIPPFTSSLQTAALRRNVAIVLDSSKSIPSSTEQSIAHTHIPSGISDIRHRHNVDMSEEVSIIKSKTTLTTRIAPPLSPHRLFDTSLAASDGEVRLSPTETNPVTNPSRNLMAKPVQTALPSGYSPTYLVISDSTEFLPSVTKPSTETTMMTESLIATDNLSGLAIIETPFQSETTSAIMLSTHKVGPTSRADALPTMSGDSSRPFTIPTTHLPTVLSKELSMSFREVTSSSIDSSGLSLDQTPSTYYTSQPSIHSTPHDSPYSHEISTVLPQPVAHSSLRPPLPHPSTSSSSPAFSFSESPSSPKTIIPAASSPTSLAPSPAVFTSLPSDTFHVSPSASIITAIPSAITSSTPSLVQSQTSLLFWPTSVIETSSPSGTPHLTQSAQLREDRLPVGTSTALITASKLNQQDETSTKVGTDSTVVDRSVHTAAKDEHPFPYTNVSPTSTSGVTNVIAPESTASTSLLMISTTAEQLSISITAPATTNQPSSHATNIPNTTRSDTSFPDGEGGHQQADTTLTTHPVEKAIPSLPGGDWSKKSGGPSITKPVKAWTAKGPTTSNRQHASRTSSFLTHDVTSPMTLTTSETPSLYVTLALRMSWTDFCARINEFKQMLLKILGPSVHDHYQLIVMPDGECGNVDNVARRSAEISVDVYIADTKGRYDLQMTSKFARKVNRRILDETPGAFKGKVLSVDVVHKHATTTTLIHGLASEQKKPTGGLSTPIIIGVAVASVLFTLVATLIIAQCVIIVRRRAVKTMRVVGYDSARPSVDVHSLEDSVQMISMATLAAASLAYTNPGLDNDDKKDYTSHPLTLVGLQELLMEPDSEDIEDEFLMLPNPMPKLCDVPDGVEDKNRYANVIPIWETRVPLISTPGGDHSTYINANFVRGYGGTARMYIATQAPMENTRIDFWEMVWQQQSQVILMLTGIEENGQSKCVNYWPNTEGSDIVRIYGDYHVQLQQRDVTPFWIRSALLLKNMETNLCRKIQHLWLTAWPHSGVPEDPAVVLSFLEAIRPYMQASHGPTVVHCSPGTGRTGTLLAVDIGVRSWGLTHTVDVLQTVRQLREDRAGAIQTMGQYQFVYKTLLEHAIGVSNPSCSSMTSSCCQ